MHAGEGCLEAVARAVRGVLAEFSAVGGGTGGVGVVSGRDVSSG